MSIFDSMATHPDVEPVFSLLELVEPVDEFSRALCLFRDCFSPSDTLRVISRDTLKELMKSRLSLMSSFQTAVITAAREVDTTVSSFSSAMSAIDPEEFDRLRSAFSKQVDELMGRPLQ